MIPFPRARRAACFSLLLGLLSLCSLAALTESAKKKTRKVLVLHSYQQGPSWVQNVTDGILSVFNRSADFDR